MCLITEHARALKRLAEVEAELAKYTLPPPPEINRYVEPADTVRERLASLNIQLLYGLLDTNYVLTDFEGWGKVFEYIYMAVQPPEYLTDKFDCEDFAIWLKAMVSAYFKLNWFGMVIGEMPLGRHGFNLFFDREHYWLWEPQSVTDGEPFRLGDRGYNPLYILI